MNTLEQAAPMSPAPWLQLVQQQVASLRFGVVQIVVHECRVVQIERTEKLRLEKVHEQNPVPALGLRAHQTPGGDETIRE